MPALLMDLAAEAQLWRSHTGLSVAEISLIASHELAWSQGGSMVVSRVKARVQKKHWLLGSSASWSAKASAHAHAWLLSVDLLRLQEV